MKCGSNLSREGSLSISPRLQSTNEDDEFQGVLEQVQNIQHYREIDMHYFRGLEIRRKNELRTRIYEGI